MQRERRSVIDRSGFHRLPVQLASLPAEIPKNQNLLCHSPYKAPKQQKYGFYTNFAQNTSCTIFVSLFCIYGKPETQRDFPEQALPQAASRRRTSLLLLLFFGDDSRQARPKMVLGRVHPINPFCQPPGSILPLVRL